MKITWNTDVNVPCCPGEILADDGRSILIQSDWDYPGTAQAFGWTLQSVQRCLQCGGIAATAGDGKPYCCDTWAQECPHDHTDGTVDCPDCGVTNSDFIGAACDWLRDNGGAVADDPGYFPEQ
jgi:hypothetical protein